MVSTQGKTVHITKHPRKVFLTNLHMSTILMQPALPLQARLQFLNDLLVLFIVTIALSKVDHIEQRPIYGFQGMLPFSNITCNLISFCRHFNYLSEKTEYKRDKGYTKCKETFEVFLFHKPKKRKRSQRKNLIQCPFMYCEIALHEASFTGY